MDPLAHLVLTCFAVGNKPLAPPGFATMVVSIATAGKTAATIRECIEPDRRPMLLVVLTIIGELMVPGKHLPIREILNRALEALA